MRYSLSLLRAIFTTKFTKGAKGARGDYEGRFSLNENFDKTFVKPL